MSGKISQNPKRRICPCGNPECSGGFSATDTSNSNFEDSIVFGSVGMDSVIIDALLGKRGYVAQATEDPSKNSRAYNEARSKVAKYILTAGREAKWGDVIGQEKAVMALREAIEEPVLNSKLYEHYGMKPPRGVLLYGPPGCGKTLLARAAAASMAQIHGVDAEFILIAGPSIQSPYVGKTEEMIRDIFSYAREYSKYRGHPLIIFLDEAEAILPDRTGRGRQVYGFEESQVATFLAEMDGVQDSGAFVILATNRPQSIDEALLRDGRCDRKIKVERPTREAAEQIVQLAFKDLPTRDPIGDLVIAAIESFYSPHRVIASGSILVGSVSRKGKPQVDETHALNFCLEHIVSGAMLMGLAPRVKNRAFHRDRNNKTITGVTVTDVIEAVTEVFEENRGLSHSFALEEFREEAEKNMRSMREHGGHIH